MAQMNGCFQWAMGISLYNWVYILVQQCHAKILISVSEEEKRMIRELSGGNMSAWVREAALSRMASERHVELMLDRQSGTERQLADIKKCLWMGAKRGATRLDLVRANRCPLSWFRVFLSPCIS